jgi:small acid-soluble spore protein (thioredoxin-like protein)
LAKPDDRSDNVRKLQAMTRDTLDNLREARDTLKNRDISDQQREAIEAKNRRREESSESFRSETKDEYHDQLE